MKKRTLLLAVGLLFCSMTWAQHNHDRCGTSAEDQYDMWPRLQENIKKSKENTGADRMIKYVPIHFHLTKTSNGTGRVSYNNVMEAMCGMNNYYAPYDIQFYFSAKPDGQLWNENIESDGVHTTQDNSFIMQLQKHQNAMNVYVSAIAASGNNGPGTTLAYYSPSFDWIVTRKDQMNRISETMTHEAGHFFSLMHTFLGWESGTFDQSHPSWPVAPANSPGGNPTELVNGTNCTVAADGFCDTPPDYNFGISAGGCSPYNGGAQDPNGVTVDPMENNIMSYFQNCADWMFTADQGAAMTADIDSPGRNYLDNNFVPASTEITTPTDLINYPQNNDITPYFNNIDLDWQAVTGATHYLVDIDIAPNFLTSNARSMVVEGNTLTVNGLTPNKKYYLRIKPFNYHVTCADARQVVFFTNDTPLANREILSINEWSVSPNPVSFNDFINLNVDANTSFDANVSVMDLAGKVIYQSNGQNFAQGQSSVQVPVAGLSNGVYFVKLDSRDALSTKKFVVLR